MKISFTEYEISKPNGKGRFINSKQKQTLYYDTKQKGLGLRVSDKSRVYFFEGKYQGKTIRLSIGDVNHWSLNNASEKARQMQISIDDGRNPKIVKIEKINADIQKQIAIDVSSGKVSELWQKFIDYKKTQFNKRTKKIGLSERHIKDIETSVLKGKPLYFFANMKISEINTDTVLIWLKNENRLNRPAYTALSYRYLRNFIRWITRQKQYKAILNDINFESDFKDHLPIISVKENDWLELNDLKSWFIEVTKLKPILSVYLQTLLLTGARRGEVASLRWNNINFIRETMTIKDKNAGERTIGLTPYIAQMLSNLPKINEYVFYSNSVSGYLTEPTKAHKRALELAGIQSISLHGLRRSFMTYSLNEVEMPTNIMNKIVGHSPKTTAEKYYIQRPIGVIKKWQNLIEHFILEQAGIEQPKAETQILKKVS